MYNINWLIIQVKDLRLCVDYLRKRHKIRCRSTGLSCFNSEILYQLWTLSSANQCKVEAQCLIEEGYRKAVYGKTVCTV